MKSFEGLQVGDLCFIRYNDTVNDGLYDLIRVVTVNKQRLDGRIIICDNFLCNNNIYPYDLTANIQVIKL